MLKLLVLIILTFLLFCFAFEKRDKKVKREDEGSMGWEGRWEGGKKWKEPVRLSEVLSKRERGRESE